MCFVKFFKNYFGWSNRKIDCIRWIAAKIKFNASKYKVFTTYQQKLRRREPSAKTNNAGDYKLMVVLSASVYLNATSSRCNFVKRVLLNYEKLFYSNSSWTVLLDFPAFSIFCSVFPLWFGAQIKLTWLGIDCVN